MNWPTAPLSEIAKIDRIHADPLTIEDGTKYLGLEHIESGGRILSCHSVRPGELASSKFRFTSEHILYGKLRPYLAKISMPEFEGICSTDILPVRPGPNLDRKFLAYFLRQPAMVQYAHTRSTGANLPRLSPKALSTFEVPCPPLKEQCRIGAILDKADAICQKREQGLALADDLLKSTFLEIFGDPISNPKNWPILPLGEMLEEIRYGTSTKCQEELEGGTPVLRIPNVISQSVNWDQLKYAVLPEREHERLRMKNGDLLFVRSNGNPEYIGRCAVFTDDRTAVFASYLIRARFKDAAPVSPSFVSKAISMPSYRHRILMDAKTTAGNYNINTKSLKALPIICPPQERRELFMAFQKETMKMIEISKTDLREANDLFASLSQRAFIGEI